MAANKSPFPESLSLGQVRHLNTTTPGARNTSSLKAVFALFYRKLIPNVVVKKPFLQPEGISSAKVLTCSKLELGLQTPTQNKITTELKKCLFWRQQTQNTSEKTYCHVKATQFLQIIWYLCLMCHFIFFPKIKNALTAEIVS